MGGPFQSCVPKKRRGRTVPGSFGDSLFCVWGQEVRSVA